jgi:hypothetical protein
MRKVFLTATMFPPGEIRAQVSNKGQNQPNE